MPFGEMLLKGGAASPKQIEKSVKSGSIGFTEIFNVVVFAQGNNIESGVNVYVFVPFVEVSTGKGLHEPVIGVVFVEVVGKVGGISFRQ